MGGMMITTLEQLKEYELDLLIKEAQAEEMEAYEHFLKTGVVRYLSEEARKQMSDMSDGIAGATALESNADIAKHKAEEKKGGIQLENTVEITYVKGKGFNIAFPVGEGTASHTITEATTKTLESVLKIRRIHGASHVALPVGAKTGRVTIPKDE